MLLSEAQSLRDVAKEFSRVRRPQFLVQRNRRGKASHRPTGDPFIHPRPGIESGLQAAIAKGRARTRAPM